MEQWRGKRGKKSIKNIALDMYTDEVIVLVGGLGTRLRPIVDNLPKPLAPVADKPFLAWLLDRLAQQGMRHVYLATGYMAQALETAIGYQWKGMRISYSVESDPLGTGGALLQALSHLRGDSVHVCNGDTWLCYSLTDLEEMTRRHRAWVGMALAHVPDTHRYGAVQIADQYVVSFQEKGKIGHGLINAGCYFLTWSGIEALRHSKQQIPFSLETDFLHPITEAATKKIAGFTHTSDFIDIGIPEDYFSAQKQFAKKLHI